jgi:hypothetical protein
VSGPVIVFNEASLWRHLQSFLEYDHQSRTHWSLEKDSRRRVGRCTGKPPGSGAGIRGRVPLGEMKAT